MPRSRFPPAGRYQLSDRYRLDSWIAAGGVGEVWRAVDTVLDRAVAIKLLREEYVQDAQARARFRAEARHAGALSHPGIAQIYDYAESDPEIPPFLVMELVEGPSLAAVVAEGPLDPCRTMDVIAQTAAGLEAAHRAGLIHRDIKPANLLLTPEGQLKITDFGIAYAAGSAPLTRTGLLVGTPAYLAPERAMGASATAASDLYSLGIVAFECLTGTPPFTGVPLEVATAHRHRPLPPLPATVPPQVAALVQALTSKDAAARPPSAGQVADRAGHLRDSLPPSPAAPSKAVASPVGGSPAGNSPAGSSPAAGSPAGPPALLVDPADPLGARAPSPLAAPVSPAAGAPPVGAPPAGRSRLLADTGDSPLIGSPPGGLAGGPPGGLAGGPPGGLAAAWADDPLGAYGSPGLATGRAASSPATDQARGAGTLGADTIGAATAASSASAASSAPAAPAAYARSNRFAPAEPSRYSGRHASPGPVRPADTLGYGDPVGSGATETLLPGSPPLPPSPSGPRPPVPLGPRGLIAAALAAAVLIAAVAIWLFNGSHGGTPTTHSNSPRPTQSTSSPSLVRVSPHQLIGHPARVVERQLRALGLRVRLKPQPDFEVPPGTVLGVSPSGRVRPDTLITLTVARTTDKHGDHGHGNGNGNGNGHGNGHGNGNG